MEKILLSTYAVKIHDSQKNLQILSHFNGSDDFFTTCQNFLSDILQNISSTSESSLGASLHLTLEDVPTVDVNNRTIYGFFSSGVGGDQYQIRDIESREPLLHVQRSHAAFRDLFFYFQIPRGQSTGALILQRKAKYGIKTLLTKTLNSFLRSRGFMNYHITINNLLHGRVYRRMINEGNLKKVEFIKKRIPGTIEQVFNEESREVEIPGTLKTSILSPSGLPENYKNFVDQLFSNPDMERIEIAGIDEEFDEVEFELELNGKRKTFYIANRSRIQPDIDVTDQVVIENGIPTTSSLVSQAEELVRDIINIPLENVQ